MRVVVCWENSKEQKTAGRIADMIRSFITRSFPGIKVTTSSLVDGSFRPYRNDAEALAAEAHRLLESQEAALGDPKRDYLWDYPPDPPVLQFPRDVKPAPYGDPAILRAKLEGFHNLARAAEDGFK